MKKLYCSRDSVSGTWQDPQAFMNDHDAKRSFCWALGSANVPEGFLKDIDLYCVGNFDDNTGHVSFCDPVHVLNGFNDDVIFYRQYFENKFKEVNGYAISEEKESC